MIDTHSHLDGEEFADDLPEVIQRAKDSGIDAIFVPGICLKDMPKVMDVCTTYKDYLFPMVGLHPENVMDEDYHHVLDVMHDMLVRSTAPDYTGPAPIAVGEVGIDLYWDSTYKEQQLEVFDTQIGWAKEFDLPLMIHARGAQRELVDMMEKHRADGLTGVFHCFSGNEEEARELLSFDGFMLGIGGVSTFKKSTLPDVLKSTVPLERIVLETDSPYLAPVPHRGKRNESSFIPCVANRLSEVYNTNVEAIAQQTTENVRKVFGKCSFFSQK